ncbi:MAG: hypothetical protein DDT19_00942 [Syntrophomonadaceae bacterium]|nr:hypothetical protein [Bacillota bacterium]
MIRSMTGYGLAESRPDETIRFKVEIRSVNHRYLDVSIRLPRELQSLEDRVRKSVQQTVGRGRVDVYLSWRADSAETVQVTIDSDLAQAYYQALLQLSRFCAVKELPSLEVLSRFPDVLRVEKEQTDNDKFWFLLEPVLNKALTQLVIQRSEEGERLAADFNKRLKDLAATAKLVENRAPLVVDEYQKKMEDRLRELLGQADFDPARVLMEAAIFADKSNVTEELVRLSSHLIAFQAALLEEEPVGRKLDFLTQELLREVNTVGSKANDYLLAKLVVEMKTELEKIREQVQNIE